MTDYTDPRSLQPIPQAEKQVTGSIGPQSQVSPPQAAMPRNEASNSPNRRVEEINISLKSLAGNWECKLQDNKIYFIDHVNKRTTWDDPRPPQMRNPPSEFTAIGSENSNANVNANSQIDTNQSSPMNNVTSDNENYINPSSQHSQNSNHSSLYNPVSPQTQLNTGLTSMQIDSGPGSGPGPGTSEFAFPPQTQRLPGSYGLYDNFGQQQQLHSVAHHNPQLSLASHQPVQHGHQWYDQNHIKHEPTDHSNGYTTNSHYQNPNMAMPQTNHYQNTIKQEQTTQNNISTADPNPNSNNNSAQSTPRPRPARLPIDLTKRGSQHNNMDTSTITPGMSSQEASNSSNLSLATLVKSGSESHSSTMLEPLMQSNTSHRDQPNHQTHVSNGNTTSQTKSKAAKAELTLNLPDMNSSMPNLGSENLFSRDHYGLISTPTLPSDLMDSLYPFPDGKKEFVENDGF